MPENAAPRRARRRGPYRRRLRSRIIVSFVLLGFCLTTLFAFATNWARMRVENQLVEDVMNRNIDEYARRFASDSSRNPDLPVQQMRAFALFHIAVRDMARAIAIMAAALLASIKIYLKFWSLKELKNS
mgnify:CR=1 FL=1